MATVGVIVEKPQDIDENATNGDRNLKLEYSGLSEDLGVPDDMDKSIVDEISRDFHEDLDEHGAPASSAKAIKRVINDTHILSDDDFPKTLTTLETVKKSTESDDIEICPIETEEDDFDEEPILIEVYNEDEEHNDIEIADVSKSVTLRKSQIAAMANSVRTKMQTPKINHKADNNDSIVTPNKPIPIQSAGTIEIPRNSRELITSDDNTISPVIINHVKNPSANSDDLIAILEGEDNSSVNIDTASVEHYKLSLPSENTNGEQVLTAEEEREIAMEQIMSLPKKKKGRPKLNPALKAARDAKVPKKTKNASLVNSLVSDWDENEAKLDEATETEIVVEIRPQKKEAIVEPTFRRSRVIKKKIIWDPDAPETAINYASLAHTSGAGPARKQRKLNPKKPEQSEDDETVSITEDAISSAPAPKKKKTSEIDKLLGDEGAANMLNSLHQSNNNNIKVEGTSPGKIPRAKPIKVEPCIVQNASPGSVKAKATKIKEAKEQSPQKQPKNVTPKSVATGKKRGPQPKTSETWDYIYKSRPDDCMIIRRRSNSSYSSTASLNRTSIDLPNAPLLGDFDGGDNEHEFEPQDKRSRSTKDKFEFVKPKAKRNGKPDNDTKFQTSFDEAKNSIVDINNVFNDHNASKNAKRDEIEIDIDINEIPVMLDNGNDEHESFTQISICRFEHFTQIILRPDVVDSKSLFTVQVRNVSTFVRVVNKNLIEIFRFFIDFKGNRSRLTLSGK